MKSSHLLPVSILLAAIGICTGKGFLWKPSPEPAADVLFDYRKITLDNGMDVITLEDFSCPIVAVQVWYEVGSKDERPDRQGYAHMFEHMMFKGTDRVGEKDHFNLLRKVGGTCNAYTSFDQTIYVQTLPADQIELALWLEAERMNFLKIDQHAFDTERKVVEEELRMRENQPYGNVFKKVLRELFTEHPYRWTPIGKLSHLRSTSVPELRQFWANNYVPNNATLIIVGAIEHASAQEMARTYFGWVPPGPEPKRITVKEPVLKQKKEIRIDDENAPAGQVMVAWRTVPIGHPDEVPLDFLSEILCQGKSSRLYRAMVANSQVAVDAGGWAYNLQQDGLFIAEASLAPTSEDYAAAMGKLNDQVELIRREGVTANELEKARNQLLKSMVLTNLNVESKARMLGRAAVTYGDVSRVNALLDDIRSVTAEDVQRAAKTYLRPDRAFEFTILKNEGMDQAAKDDESMAVSAEPELQAPAPGRPGIVRPDGFPQTPPEAAKEAVSFGLDYEQAKLPNGLQVRVVSNHEVPFVAATLGLTSGIWTETKPGTAALATEMLTRGTEKYTEAELASAMDQFAISLSASADMDTSTVNMNCLTDNLDYGMLLMSDVVRAPLFDVSEFEKLLPQKATALSIQEQEPKYLAAKHFNEVLFGEHPYAKTALGSSQTLKQLSVEDLEQWWKTYAQPDSATLIFSGDITKARAVELAEKYFGTWKSTSVHPPALPAIPAAKPTTIYLVDRPGSVQAQIMVGQLGLTRKQQPDYFVSLLAGAYFGGSFHSRLNENIRVKRGLTYGAWGGFRARNFAGTFEISTYTKNASTAETIQVILDQVDKLRSVAPTDAEFYDTRSYFIGSFALQQETPQDIARDLWLIESQQLGKDYFKKLFKALDLTDQQDCTELASEIIDPDALAVIVVGDAEVLKETLSPIAEVQVIQSGRELQEPPAVSR